LSISGQHTCRSESWQSWATGNNQSL